MARSNIRKIIAPLTSIGLDELNPRLDPQNGQREAIRAMVKQQGDKILNLAADIAEHGISAAERFMAMVPEDRKFPYISLDGNRRLVALKLLHEPMLADGSLSAKAMLRLKKLADLFADDPIDEVELAVFDTREHGALWVARRHSVNMNGVGQDSWDALDKQRFDAWRGVASREWNILEFVRRHGTLAEADAQNLNKVPISTLRRLVADRYIRTQLGLEYNDGDVISSVPDANIIPPLQRMVVDLLHKRTDVTKLALSEDRKNYFDSLEETTPFRETATVVTPISPSESGEAIDAPVAEQKPIVIRPARKLTIRERRSVIPIDEPLGQAPASVQLMYRELQRADADTYPQSCAALLGVLSETSLSHYLSRTQETTVPVAEELPASTAKLQLVAAHAAAVGLLSQEQHEAIVTASENGNLFATNTSTVPSCMLWPSDAPTGAILRRYWITIAPLIQAIWP